MINYSIKINGKDYTNKIKTGFPLTTKLNEELDTGVVIIPFEIKKEPFSPLSLTEINIDDTKLHFFVDTDNVKINSVNPLVYTHTITLIELVKMFEKIQIPNLAFTQPISNEFEEYNLYSVLERIRQNAELTLLGEDKLFELDETLLPLKSVKAPQMSFNKASLREALDQVFSVVDGITRVVYKNGKYYIKCDYFNETKQLINELEKAHGIFSERGLEYYSTSAEMYIENATNDFETVQFPDKNNFVNLRGVGGVIDTNEAIWELTHPIYEIIHAEMRVKTVTKDSDVSGEFVVADITSFIFEKEKWRALDVPTPDRVESSIPGNRNQVNSIYFTKGDNKIENIYGSYTIKGLFDKTVTTIEAMLAAIRFEQPSLGIFAGGGSYPTVKGDKFEVGLRITYRTKINSRIRVVRDDVRDFEVKTQLPINQNNNLVDLGHTASNLRGVINKLGNNTINVVKRCSGLENVYKLGDYTNQGYICTQVENIFYKDFVLSSAIFSKNYNELSKFIGVNTEVRQIPIPLASTECRLHYDNYCDVSFTKSEQSNCFIRDVYRQKLLSTMFGNPEFKAVNGKITATYGTWGDIYIPSNSKVISSFISTPYSAKGIIDYEFWNIDTGTLIIKDKIPRGTYYSKDVDLEPNNHYLLKILDSGTEDVLNLNYTYYVSVPAFEKHLLANFDGKVLSSVDTAGISNSLKFDFGFNDNISAGNSLNTSSTLKVQEQNLYADKYGRLDNFSLELFYTSGRDSSIANLYPKDTIKDFFKFKITDKLYFDFSKDAREILKMTMQLHFTSTEENIILHDITRLINKTFVGNDRLQFYYSNTETYSRRDTMAKGNSGDFTYIIENDSIKINNAEVVGSKSIALATPDGKILLAINNPKTDTIYFNFKERRN